MRLAKPKLKKGKKSVNFADDLLIRTRPVFYNATLEL